MTATLATGPATATPAPARAPVRRRRKPVAKDGSAAHLHLVHTGTVAGAQLTGPENDIVTAALSLLACRLRRHSPVFDAPQAVRDYLLLALATKPHEVFAVMFLDSQHGLIAFEEMFSGTLMQTSVYPREVVTRVLHHQAATVILAHNHPSGNAYPSDADVALTKTLKASLALVDVRVLDHFVVGGMCVTSMAELGMV
jgi:DNA repair protein RadC